MRTAENHTSLWRRFEAVCLHPRLFEEQLILARARLMLYTAFASGLVAVPVIIYSFAKRPEMSDANVVLSVGHVMYASTFVLLRFFPTSARLQLPNCYTVQPNQPIFFKHC